VDKTSLGVCGELWLVSRLFGCLLRFSGRILRVRMRGNLAFVATKTWTKRGGLRGFCGDSAGGWGRESTSQLFGGFRKPRFPGATGTTCSRSRLLVQVNSFRGCRLLIATKRFAAKDTWPLLRLADNTDCCLRLPSKMAIFSCAIAIISIHFFAC
jgi:hypothetical protein